MATADGAGGSVAASSDGRGEEASASTGIGASAGASPVASGSTAGVGGLIVLMRRGGPRVGAAGLGGSTTFLAAEPFLLPPVVLADVLPNGSPCGSEMFRFRASRLTNWRATISSTVLDALFSSIPWSRFRRARTSWLVVPMTSAIL